MTAQIKIYSEVTMLPVDKLVPNDWNPNEMDPKKYELLREEIKKFGWLGNPLIVREHPKDSSGETYEIIDGEHRWRAGKEEGMLQEPCVILEVDPKDEASFRTYALNNFRGEINEVKLAILVKNWRDKGISANAIFGRTGIRGHKQRALMEVLVPKDMSKKAIQGSKGQHRSFAVILTLEENEIVHRAIKLTRLHNDVDCLMAITDYYLEHHSLTVDQQKQLEKLIEEVDETSDSQGLVQLSKYYLENVKKGDIRKDE